MSYLTLDPDLYMVKTEIVRRVYKNLDSEYSEKRIPVTIFSDGSVLYGYKKLNGEDLSDAIKNNAQLRRVLECVEEWCDL